VGGCVLVVVRGCVCGEVMVWACVWRGGVGMCVFECAHVCVWVCVCMCVCELVWCVCVSLCECDRGRKLNILKA
jgi:hypothetical protein